MRDGSGIMTCEQAESLLVRAAEGTLDTKRQAALDLHVAGCAACRGELDAQRSARALLAARPDAAVRPGFATRVMANLPAQDPAGALDAAAVAGGAWLDLLNWRAWTIRLAPVATTLAVAATLGFGSATNGADETAAAGEAIAFTDLAAAWATDDGANDAVTRLWQDEADAEGDDLLIDLLLAGQ
ncbi:MAG: zf-HC2 domain-containing protein [Acidobacteria bacterium]|nr:zf-HC2 domain-containing protein [Acidobacteriota bacterium]